MKKQEVKIKLFNGVSEFLSQNDFTLLKQSSGFIRKLNGSNQIIDFFFYKRGESIEIEPAIRIKLEAIEKIYQSISFIE